MNASLLQSLTDKIRRFDSRIMKKSNKKKMDYKSYKHTVFPLNISIITYAQLISTSDAVRKVERTARGVLIARLINTSTFQCKADSVSEDSSSRKHDTCDISNTAQTHNPL